MHQTVNMETYFGLVRTPADAIKLFEACRLGLLPRVQRRLSEKERHAIRPGSVFVWDEREAGMRRWTDGKSWSASRVSGSFLTYREMEGKRGSGFGSNRRNTSSKTLDSGRGSSEDHEDAEPEGYRYKADGLLKQSFSITTSTGQHLHLISYYCRPVNGQPELTQPTKDPSLRHIAAQKGLYPESSVHDSNTGPALSRSAALTHQHAHPHIQHHQHALQHHTHSNTPYRSPYPNPAPSQMPQPQPYHSVHPAAAQFAAAQYHQQHGSDYGWPPSPLTSPIHYQPQPRSQTHAAVAAAGVATTTATAALARAHAQAQAQTQAKPQPTPPPQTSMGRHSPPTSYFPSRHANPPYPPMPHHDHAGQPRTTLPPFSAHTSPHLNSVRPDSPREFTIPPINSPPNQHYHCQLLQEVPPPPTAAAPRSDSRAPTLPPLLPLATSLGHSKGMYTRTSVSPHSGGPSLSPPDSPRGENAQSINTGTSHKGHSLSLLLHSTPSSSEPSSANPASATSATSSPRTLTTRASVGSSAGPPTGAPGPSSADMKTPAPYSEDMRVRGLLDRRFMF